jgi:hypothetical protein
MNFRRRHYDASAGRFIGADPIGYRSGDVNTYRYCGGNPAARTDQFGTDWLDTYSNWFNGVFGSGYSNAVGGAIHNGVVGTGMVSNATLANASANELAVVTGGVVTGAVVAGATTAGAAIAIGSSEVGAELVVTSAGPFLAAGAMTYESASSAALALAFAYPYIWVSAVEFLDPAWTGTVASDAGSIFFGYVLPFIIDAASDIMEQGIGHQDRGCDDTPPGWDGYIL